ncbi:MAG: hypothetical protein ACREYD_05850 [Casimicrobiaceae bacterium]
MRRFLLAVTLSLALSGCAMMAVVGPPHAIKVGSMTVTVAGLDGFNPFAVQTPDPNGPAILVVDNHVLVNQEPLYPRHSDDQVVIVWRLDASEASPYYFADNEAIKLHAGASNPLPADLACGAFGPRNKAFVCAYRKPATPKQWKYSIRVKNRTGRDPDPIDPWVHQN